MNEWSRSKVTSSIKRKERVIAGAGTAVLPHLTTVGDTGLVFLQTFVELAFLEVGLVFLLAPALLFQAVIPKPSFLKHPLHSLGLAHKFRVDGDTSIPSSITSQEYHALLNPIPHFVFRMAGCFPPGRRFILLATCASLLLHACPLELLPLLLP